MADEIFRLLSYTDESQDTMFIIVWVESLDNPVVQLYYYRDVRKYILQGNYIAIKIFDKK